MDPLAELCGTRSISASTRIWRDLLDSFVSKRPRESSELDNWISPFVAQLVKNNPKTGNFQSFLSQLTKRLQALQRAQVQDSKDVAEDHSLDYCCSFLQLAQFLTTRLIQYTTLRSLPSYFNLTETSHFEERGTVENSVLVPLVKVLIDCIGNEKVHGRVKFDCICLLVSMSSSVMYHHDESEGSHFLFERLESLPEVYHFQLLEGLLRCCIMGQAHLRQERPWGGVFRAGFSFAKNSVLSLWPPRGAAAASNGHRECMGEKTTKLGSQCLLLCLLLYQSRSAQHLMSTSKNKCWDNPWQHMISKCTNASVASHVSFKAVSGKDNSANAPPPPHLVLSVSFQSLLEKLGVDQQPGSVDYLLLYSFLFWNSDFRAYCVSSTGMVLRLLQHLVQTLRSVGKLERNLEKICIAILFILFKEQTFLASLANDGNVKEDLWIALLRIFKYHSLHRSSDRCSANHCLTMLRMMLSEEKIHLGSKASQFSLALLSTVFKCWQKNPQKIELESFLKALIKLMTECLAVSSKRSTFLFYNLLYYSDLVKRIHGFPVFADTGADVLQKTVSFFEGKMIGSQQLSPQQVQEIIEDNTEEWSRIGTLPSFPNIDHSYEEEYPESQVVDFTSYLWSLIAAESVIYFDVSEQTLFFPQQILPDSELEWD